jgi:hypothetical protein
VIGDDGIYKNLALMLYDATTNTRHSNELSYPFKFEFFAFGPMNTFLKNKRK